ncbi:MAG: hydroxyacylglutathione hydrolase [Gaiellaceae bacterium]|jgi:glyoxylase-like metal-dependent hydrolase (beta-lactamase superfamily II)|nr:hydroxyacylglutathione hydrolase [Gaiellaceae bacterium]
MSLVVDSVTLGEFDTNCFVVRATPEDTDVTLIDPGAEPDLLWAELQRLRVRPVGILLTHTDADHVGAVADMAERSGAGVWCPSAEASVLRDPQVSLRPLARTSGLRPYDPEHLVSGGDRIDVAGITFDVLDVPGHSAGHIAFYAGGCLFSGDLLFAGSIGHARHAGGDWETLLTSVRLVMEAFPPETVVYPGHGPATTLGDERANVPAA